MKAEQKLGGDGKSLLPSWISLPLIIMVFALLLLPIFILTVIAIVVGVTGFIFWGIFNYNLVPTKSREIQLILSNIWEESLFRIRKSQRP
jgi:hypothetical protein